jgi:serine protease inhibitor ecotin
MMAWVWLCAVASAWITMWAFPDVSTEDRRVTAYLGFLLIAVGLFGTFLAVKVLKDE